MSPDRQNSPDSAPGTNAGQVVDERVYLWLLDYVAMLEFQAASLPDEMKRDGRVVEASQNCAERALQVRRYLATWKVSPP